MMHEPHEDDFDPPEGTEDFDDDALDEDEEDLEENGFHEEDSDDSY